MADDFHDYKSYLSATGPARRFIIEVRSRAWTRARDPEWPKAQEGTTASLHARCHPRRRRAGGGYINAAICPQGHRASTRPVTVQMLAPGQRRSVRVRTRSDRRPMEDPPRSVSGPSRAARSDAGATLAQRFRPGRGHHLALFLDHCGRARLGLPKAGRLLPFAGRPVSASRGGQAALPFSHRFLVRHERVHEAHTLSRGSSPPGYVRLRPGGCAPIPSQPPPHAVLLLESRRRTPPLNILLRSWIPYAHRHNGQCDSAT